MSEEENLSDLEGLSDVELDDDEDLEALEAELAGLSDEGEDSLDEEEMRRLEAEVAEMEDELGEVSVASEEEDDQDFEESGNLFIGALQRPKYASLMTNLEEEIKREQELAKTRPRDTIPKYLVNPFALPNRLDYEEIFDEIDPEEPDLKIWKLEKFEPVPVSLREFSKFYSGDCYVVLYITEAFEGGVVINIHHWIGEQASNDKYGAAAFRAVELNMFMGGRCHIYREMEGRETQKFIDYFEGRLEYLVGGTATGFKHVVSNSPKEHRPSLYQLIPQSTGQLVMKLVELSVDSLDSEFIFILDAGKRIYQWNGQFVQTKYRHWATAHAYTIRSNDRRGQAAVIILTEDSPDEMLAYEEDIFWRYLKGRKAVPGPNASPPVRTVEKRFVFEEEDAEDLEEEILAVSVAGSWDNFYEPVPMVRGEYGWDLELPLKPGRYTYQYRVATADGVKSYCDMVRETTTNHLGEVNIVQAVVELDQFYQLWGTSSKGGKLSLNEIDYEGVLERKLLTSQNAYILDCCSELFLWVGRHCKPLEKQVALAIAKKIYAKYERPDWAPILGVYETAELTTFTSKFVAWDHLRSGQAPKRRPRAPRHVRFSLPSIVNVEGQLRDLERDPEPMLDNGSGTVEVRLFTMKDGASQTAIPPNTTGVFFTESCYIVLYKYEELVNGRKVKKFLVYFWTGLGCKTANAAYAKFTLDFAKMLLDRVGEARLSTVRVFEGKEPKHFMRLFNGRLVVKRGAQGSYSRHLSENTLYHVYIASHLVGYPCMHVNEVEATTSSLASVRCFLLFTAVDTYIWVGAASYPEEEEVAAGLCRFISNTNYHTAPDSPPLIVHEGEATPETETFYKHLPGGLEQICALPTCTGRLYAISNAQGLMNVTEVPRYTQMDLVEHTGAMLLLHTKDTIFLWQGEAVIPSLQLTAQRIAAEWVAQVASMREEHDSPSPQRIAEETQGAETAAFKAFFPGWQDDYGKRAFFEEVTVAHEKRLQGMYKELVTLQGLQKEIDTLQDQIELLELISASSDYSKAEENATNPKFNRVNVSFDKELVALGLKEAPPVPKVDKLALLKEGVQPGEFFFHWEQPALAVALKGSWNDWQQTPLVNYGSQGFATKLALEPGRYYFRYVVATQEGATSAVDSELPTSRVTVEGEDEEVNILRVYTCTHPTYLNEQRKLKEDEEEAKKRAEEEANRTLTVEEVRKRDREWKEQQRIANEERLRRQLEEKRRNRRHATITEVEVEDDKGLEYNEDLDSPLLGRKTRVPRRTRASILDESDASRRASRASPGRSESPVARKTEDSSMAYSKTLLNNLSSRTTASARAYKPNQDIANEFEGQKKSTDSYRERRRAELGLGGGASTAKKEKEKDTPSVSRSSRVKVDSPSRSSSLLDRLEDKLDTAISSPSRSTSSSYRDSYSSTRDTSSPSRSTSTRSTSTASTSASTSCVSASTSAASPSRTSATTSTSSTQRVRTASSRAAAREASTSSSDKDTSSARSSRASSSTLGTSDAADREAKRRERRRALGLE